MGAPSAPAAPGSRTGPARRVAGATLAVGFLLSLAAAAAAPLPAPPLYDGVVPVEPYQWVSPPPGQHGGAQGASADLPVSGGQSPLVALATPELSPQAQLFAAPGALTLPSGTTSLHVAIAPVAPDVQPSDGHIAGNVYRVTVTTQAGASVTAPASAEVSLALSAPDQSTTQATIERFSNGAWQPLQTDAAGLAASFLAVVTDFGDFALVEPGAAGSPPAGSGSASGGSPNVPSAGASPAESSSGSPTAPPVEPGGIPTVSVLAGAAVLVILVALVIGALRPPGRKPGSWSGQNRRPRR